jgi:hypothetical protein
MQGKADAARKLLAEALAKMDQRRWNDRQQKSASELSCQRRFESRLNLAV